MSLGDYVRHTLGLSEGAYDSEVVYALEWTLDNYAHLVRKSGIKTRVVPNKPGVWLEGDPANPTRREVVEDPFYKRNYLLADGGRVSAPDLDWIGPAPHLPDSPGWWWATPNHHTEPEPVRVRQCDDGLRYSDLSGLRHPVEAFPGVWGARVPSP